MGSRYVYIFPAPDDLFVRGFCIYREGDGGKGRKDMPSDFRFFLCADPL